MGNQKSSIEEKELTDEQKLIRSQIFANPFIAVDNDSFSVFIPLRGVNIRIKQFEVNQSDDAYIVAKEALDFVENKLIPRLHKLFEFEE